MLLLVFAVGLLALSLPVSVLGQKCQQVGVQCGPGCGSVIYCISIGDNNPLIINSCTSGTFCTEDSPGSFSCSATSCNGGSGESPFICLLEPNQLPVNFPDPFNTSNSFLCGSSGSFPLQQCTCPVGQCFSTVTQCTPFDSSTPLPCGREVPLPCPSTGTFDSLSSDLGYYYTCDANGARLIRKCPGANDYYETSRQECLPIPPPKGRKTQSTPKALGSCGAYVPPEGGPNPPNNGTVPTCTRPGQQFPGPTCTSFYLCNNTLQAVLLQCPANQYYNATRRGCVPGQCTNQVVAMQNEGLAKQDAGLTKQDKAPNKQDKAPTKRNMALFKQDEGLVKQDKSLTKQDEVLAASRKPLQDSSTDS